MNFLLRILTVGFFVLSASWLHAAPVKVEQASVELIADVAQIVPGESFQVAVHFELEPHWHIYWQNPGSSGFPLELTWELPEGLESGAIQWPSPQRFELDGFITYGYEDTVTFMVPIAVAESFHGDVATISVGAFWLTCKEMCLPAEAKLSLSLLVGDESQESEHSARFQQALGSLPAGDAPWELSASYRSETKEAILRLVFDEEAPLPTELYFYANKEGVVNPNASQTLSSLGSDTVELRLSLDEPVDGLSGVLQGEDGSWAIDMDFGGRAAAAPRIAELNSGGFEQSLLNFGLPGFLALAFLGGLILNVMPCVLPVLSLKVFSLLKHSGQSKQQALAHGLAYTVGVVLSFIALAGALFALRAVGERIGWGFQLQNPNFIVLLVVVFFLFGLNLMGVFEIGTSFIGADNKVSQRNDVLGSFGMGILAAVVGAPCMGPLVASVSGIAVQANIVTGLLIFGTMGLGLASPFLMLSVFPKLVAYLPKPGVWMESFKQFMGFLLMVAVIFLASVAGRQGGVDAISAILVVLLLTAMAAWIYGRWAAPVKPRRSKVIATLLSAALTIGAITYGILGAKATDDEKWQAWSTDRVESELAAGNPVFIDFTATWCLICQVNKKVALRTEGTNALFDEYGVVTLVADWTLRDGVIADEIERFGRTGVPLYVLYAPNGEVTLLPQSLTPGIIREAVERALR
ncbi:MAG: protein-disulfide reductase DsbD family protein [Lentimonas sp.]